MSTYFSSFKSCINNFLYPVQNSTSSSSSPSPVPASSLNSDDSLGTRIKGIANTCQTQLGKWSVDAWKYGERQGYIKNDYFKTGFCGIGAAVGGCYGYLKKNPAAASVLGKIGDRISTVANLAILGAGVGLLVYYMIKERMDEKSAQSPDLSANPNSLKDEITSNSSGSLSAVVPMTTAPVNFDASGGSDSSSSNNNTTTIQSQKVTA